MSSSSRKRINSIEVSQLVSQIKQMSNNSNSIYLKLNSYDHLIKKYQIDPLDSTALQIYQFLIQEETLATLPPQSRIQMDSFKFSRNRIDLIEDEPLQLHQQNRNVQDPQTHNDKLFSFAKNHKHQHSKIPENDLKPKQLFNHLSIKEKEKSKSDNKPQHNPIFFADLPKSKHHDQNKPQTSTGQRKQSVQTISQLSNSQSESNLCPKDVVFNSQKTKPLPKHQPCSPTSLLTLHLKHKHFKHFLALASADKKQFQAIQNRKKIQYFYCMRLLRLSFKGLLSNLLAERSNFAKALQFEALKSQYFLEEYFVEWKQLTLLPAETKERHEQIQGKFKLLTSWLFIKSLMQNCLQIQSIRENKIKQKQMIKIKSHFLHRTLFFTTLSYKFKALQIQRAKTQQSQQLLQLNSSKNFILKLKEFIETERQKQTQRINKCIMKVKGRSFIEGLKNEQNFNEVYWRRKQNAKKLIFLNYLLSAAKLSFQRLGYQYSWMPQLQQSINATDRKLQKVLSKDIKLKTFTRLARLVRTQKQNKHRIKVMLMDNFLKCLAFSSYVGCRRKSDLLKTESVQQLLYLNNGMQLIEVLGKRADKNIEIRQKALRTYLRDKKCQEFFIYLESYHASKEFYSDNISRLQQKSKHRFLSEVWFSFKRVLKGQIINNKLVAEYLNLKNKIIEERCFEALKTNIFDEKLFRKKQQNLIKLIKHRRFTSFCGKLQENLSYQPKIKSETICSFDDHLTSQRKSQFFKIWTNSRKEKSLKHKIEQRLIKNYQQHIASRSFNVLKFVTVKTKEERLMGEQISQVNSLRVKSLCFQRFVVALIERRAAKMFIVSLQKCKQVIESELIDEFFNKIRDQGQK